MALPSNWMIFIVNSTTVRLMCLYIEPNYAITSQIQRQKMLSSWMKRGIFSRFFFFLFYTHNIFPLVLFCSHFSLMLSWTNVKKIMKRQITVSFFSLLYIHTHTHASYIITCEEWTREIIRNSFVKFMAALRKFIFKTKNNVKIIIIVIELVMIFPHELKCHWICCCCCCLQKMLDLELD